MGKPSGCASQIMTDICSCDYKADKMEELLFISNPFLDRIPCLGSELTRNTEASFFFCAEKETRNPQSSIADVSGRRGQLLPTSVPQLSRPADAPVNHSSFTLLPPFSLKRNMVRFSARASGSCQPASEHLRLLKCAGELVYFNAF